MYKIVVIDDEENIVEGIANLFPWNEMGFEIQACFHDPAQMLKYLQHENTDVLICDIEMPGINGVQVAEALKESGIRIVFISSYQNFEYMHGAIVNHVEDYLLKPIKYSKLSECFLKIRRQLDEQYSVAEEKHQDSFYDEIIHNVQEYVDENFRTATLEKAAERVHLSTGYLSKIFKEVSGEGFHDYLMKVRMNKACECLRNIEFRSYDVAYYIGYENPKNFSRAFKNYFGKTPSEYRKNYNILED